EGGDMTGAIAPTKPLSALDLCDRCGAQAYVRVVLAGGGELLFCAHHWRQHGEALARVALEIQDETDRLSPGTAEAPAAERCLRPSGWLRSSPGVRCGPALAVPSRRYPSPSSDDGCLREAMTQAAGNSPRRPA